MMMSAPNVKPRRSPFLFSHALALDLVELVIVLVLYLNLIMRLFASVGEVWQLTNLLLLPSEGLVVVFLLLRRRTENISMRWQEWLLALSATAAPMLVQPGVGAALVPLICGVSLLLMGTIIQVHAKLTLGRSFGCVPANRGLKLVGPYRYVRHPMYAGYLLGHIAFLMMNPTVWNIVVYAMCYTLQVPRLLNEEKLLQHDLQYRLYQTTVRYRLIPGVF